MSEQHPEQNEQETVEQPPEPQPVAGDTGSDHAEAEAGATHDDRSHDKHAATATVLPPDSAGYVTTTTTRTFTTADEATTVTTTRTEPYAGPVAASYPRPVG